jgi:hypothetical protein
MKIHKTKWAITGGLWWGISIAFFAIVTKFTGAIEPIVTALGTAYIGYSTSLIGILIGFIWAFVDMFIGVWILLWLYEWVNSWKIWKK